MLKAFAIVTGIPTRMQFVGYFASYCSCAADTAHIIASSYLYNREYAKCVEFCGSELLKREKDEPQLLAATVAAHYQLAKVSSVMQSAVRFIPIIIKNSWWSPHSAITNGGVEMEEPFWFIRCSAAGHWLCTVLLNTLRPLLTETSDDLLISTILLLSQVDFASVGFSAFNEAITIAENKESFKSTVIFEFIGDLAVMDRIVFMASSRPECFLPESTEDAQAELQKVIEARLKVIDEAKKIKLTILYLSKIGNDFVRLLQSMEKS
uniref:ARM repeat superfamily protein n=1 Tax=Angiostrongylus cantonensis TaxID=6313 RepID=A0A0K0D4G6_ANGCA